MRTRYPVIFLVGVLRACLVWGMSDFEQFTLFQVTAFDPPLRDSRDVMEYPFLSIQKGRRRPIEFTSADKRVQLHISAPEAFGIATIWDWDSDHLPGRQLERCAGEWLCRA